MKRKRSFIAVENSDENVSETEHGDDTAEISDCLPVAKKPRMMTGKLSPDPEEEKLRVLTNFRRHGSRKWKEISTIVQTRERELARRHGQGECEHLGATEPSSSLVVDDGDEGSQMRERPRTKKLHTAKDVTEKVAASEPSSSHAEVRLEKPQKLDLIRIRKQLTPQDVAKNVEATEPESSSSRKPDEMDGFNRRESFQTEKQRFAKNIAKNERFMQPSLSQTVDEMDECHERESAQTKEQHTAEDVTTNVKATELSSYQAVDERYEPQERESIRVKKQHTAYDARKKETRENLMGVLTASYEGRGVDVKVSFLPLLCVEIERKGIVGCERLEQCGCVIDVFLDSQALHIERIVHLVRRRLDKAYGTRRRSSLVLDCALHHLICLETDGINDILKARARYDRLKTSKGRPFIVIGKDELQWWSGMPIRLEESTSLREFAFLRRLAMPICLRLHAKVEVTVCFPDFSLLDVLLRIEIAQSVTIDALMLRIVQIESFAPRANKPLDSLARDLQRRLLSSINQAVRVNCATFDQARFLDSLKFMLALTFVPSGFRKMVSNELCDVHVASDINTNHLVELQQDLERCQSIAKSWKIPTKEDWQNNPLAWTRRPIVGFETRSYPSEIDEERQLIHNMRQVLLGKKDAIEVMSAWLPEKLAKKAAMLAGKNEGGSLLITASEMPIKTFLRHAGLMNKVNASFHRPLDRIESRPRFRELNLPLASITAIKSVFFDEDGSLRNEIKKDIDMSLKHGYINFSNTSCPHERSDKRWQVPIRHHYHRKSHCVPFDMISIYGSSSSDQIKVRRIGTRDSLESVLASEQVVFPQVETLDDVGMLIAGTEDQPLHHDVARTFSGWVSSKAKYNAKEEDPVAGWEVGRVEYNEAMASQYAPGSIIVRMGDEAFLGVQNDQIRKVAPGRCTVVGGTGETFEVVRETEDLVVLRTKCGFMFAGDFPHAGVRNVSQKSPENDLVDLLNERISHIQADKPFLNSGDQLAAVINMLCEFPGLNQICRFHCTTRLLEGKMKPPFNTVGFTNCLPNPPREDSYSTTSLLTLE